MSNRSKRNKRRDAALALAPMAPCQPVLPVKKADPVNPLLVMGDAVCLSIAAGAIGLVLFISGSAAFLMGAWLLSPFLRAVGWL